MVSALADATALRTLAAMPEVGAILLNGKLAVSYTHLTLPTSDLV